MKKIALLLKQIEVVITTSDAICQAISEVQETPVQTINQQCISVNLIP